MDWKLYWEIIWYVSLYEKKRCWLLALKYLGDRGVLEYYQKKRIRSFGKEGWSREKIVWDGCLDYEIFGN